MTKHEGEEKRKNIAWNSGVFISPATPYISTFLSLSNQTDNKFVHLVS